MGLENGLFAAPMVEAPDEPSQPYSLNTYQSY